MSAGRWPGWRSGVAAGSTAGRAGGLRGDRERGPGQTAVAPQTLIRAGAVGVGMPGPPCGKASRALVFGKHNKFRDDRWVFGDRDSGAYLWKTAATFW